ncbi:MAG: AMP-binding protein [Deltaproteobacteria bacterium]|nr:AMP-binding protein [Deltaproteobacteria bacterium]MBW2303530.1 AMP-binding protein [Deltaproteobacteria bacterium]
MEKELKLLEGFTPYRKEDAERYDRLRWWSGLTFGDILDRAAAVYPDKEAFVDGETRLTYARAKDAADRLAVSLMDLGIEPLDRVLVQLPNWNEFVYTYFALQKIGAITVLLIDRYRQYEVHHLLRLTDAVAWILPERYRKTDYLPVIRDVLRENPRVKQVILARGGFHEAYLNLEELIENAELSPQNKVRLEARRPDPRQVAHMGPTGGTTGRPKIVPRTHNDLICGSEYAARAWEMNVHDTCLLAGPIGHDLTFSKGLLASILTYGKTVFLDSTDPEDICRTIEKERVTAVVWVPTLARRLVDFEDLKKYDLGSLQKMHCGGGASHPDLITAVRERLKCEYFNAYGATEGQSTMTRPGDDLDTRFKTVGRPTCPYDTYKVVDPNGKEQPPNTPGELLVKGPGVFTGYFRNPEENEKAIDKDGFFKTGDVAKIDERGYITLTGRIKEMINRGGESISAVEIEKLISGHPGVALCAVVPMPDPEMHEKVCAYVQPEAGADLSFEGIISFLKGKKVSVLHLPERIEFVDSMPFTKAEKIDKRALRADIEKKLEAARRRSPRGGAEVGRK